MPLSNLTLNSVLQWSLSKTNIGTTPTIQGPARLNVNLAGVDVSTVNQLFQAQFSLAGNGVQTVDLTSLTNTIGESFGFGHVLAIMVVPNGNDVTIQPGPTNSLQWFFGGTTSASAITVYNGGGFVNTYPGTATGTVVNPYSKSLLFTNASGASCNLNLAIVGSTT